MPNVPCLPGRSQVLRPVGVAIRRRDRTCKAVWKATAWKGNPYRPRWRRPVGAYFRLSALTTCVGNLTPAGIGGRSRAPAASINQTVPQYRPAGWRDPNNLVFAAHGA